MFEILLTTDGITRRVSCDTYFDAVVFFDLVTRAVTGKYRCRMLENGREIRMSEYV